MIGSHFHLATWKAVIHSAMSINDMRWLDMASDNLLVQPNSDIMYVSPSIYSKWLYSSSNVVNGIVLPSNICNEMAQFTRILANRMTGSFLSPQTLAL